jgi:hypothetical protein
VDGLGGRDGLKHTKAAEIEAFLGKPLSAQLLEIWINGKETNGSVAYAFKLIDDLGHDMQKQAIAFTEHFEGHLSLDEMAELEKIGAPGVTEARMEMWSRVNEMWKWFTTGRIIVIALLAVQPLMIALFVWWMNR